MKSGIPPDGIYDEEARTYLTGSGQLLVKVHSREACHGPYCVIHNPSNHHMRDWPTNWRDDKGHMERICPHGIGHPDPDDPFADPVHGCDSCCAPPKG